MSEVRRFFRRLVALLRGRPADADLAREISAHLQLLEEKFGAEGMSPEAARFAAKRAFGNIGQTKELQRHERSFQWLVGWAMELKLGVRMLVRYPGLTLVGVLAMAFAIVVGVGTFEIVQRATKPVLPLPDGERIVGFNYWDRVAYGQESPTPYDFLTWREGLRAVEDIGGFRLLQRNLAMGEETGAPVEVAEISAAAFLVTRVALCSGALCWRRTRTSERPQWWFLGSVCGRPVSTGIRRSWAVSYGWATHGRRWSG